MGGVAYYKSFSAKGERDPEFGAQRSRSRKMLRKLLIVMLSGLFLWFCPRAWGANWKYFGQTPDASYYYDTEDIVHQENVVRVWMKAVYSREGRKKEAEKMGGNLWNVTDSTALEEINYKDKNQWTATLVVYSMEGKMVISDTRERKMDFILPDSILEGFYKTLCNNG
jgi:Surface-adhesin protein E